MVMYSLIPVLYPTSTARMAENTKIELKAKPTDGFLQSVWYDSFKTTLIQFLDISSIHGLKYVNYKNSNILIKWVT